VKRFEFDFEDEGPRELSYVASDTNCERLDISQESETSALYLNREAAQVLAEIFARLALGSYQPGFHLHIPRNFNDQDREVMRVTLVSSGCRMDEE